MKRGILTLLTASVLLLAGCAISPGAAAPTDTPSTAPQPTVALETATLAVVGDSLTAVSNTDFVGGEIDATSWLQVPLRSGYTFAGGWAVVGARTETMRAEVDVRGADLLVIMAGTNDVFGGIRYADTEANIAAIADSVDAGDTVVSAILPIDSAPGAAEEFNAELQRFVTAEGWTWIDPFAPIRDGERFAEGTTLDGIHPTPEAQLIVGEGITAELDRLLGR